MKTINKNLSLYYLLSILPTIIMGLFRINTYNNNYIWIFDALIIILLFLYCIFSNLKIKKNDLLISSIFIFIIGIQFIDYYFALKNNMIPILYIVLPVLYLVHFFCTNNLISNIKISNISFDTFFNFFLIFVIICCLYNMLINYNNIPSILNYTNKYIGLSSFFSHRNAFGQLLFVGLVVNYYLLLIANNKRFYFFSILLILVNLILSFSRSSILASIIFFLVVFCYETLLSKNKKRIIALILIIILIAFAWYSIRNNENIMQFLNFYIFRSEDGLSGRDNIWNLALSKLHGFRIITGYGIGTSPYILSDYNLSNTHNSIIELLLSGGIVLLFFYLFIFKNILKTIMKIKNIHLKKVYLAFYISFIVYSMFEKVILFSTGYAPIMFTIFLCIIPNLIVNGDDYNEK